MDVLTSIAPSYTDLRHSLQNTQVTLKGHEAQLLRTKTALINYLTASQADAAAQPSCKCMHHAAPISSG